MRLYNLFLPPLKVDRDANPTAPTKFGVHQRCAQSLAPQKRDFSIRARPHETVVVGDGETVRRVAQNDGLNQNVILQCRKLFQSERSNTGTQS